MRRAAMSAVVVLSAVLLSGCGAMPQPPGAIPQPPGATPAPTHTVEHGPQGEAPFAAPGPFVIRYDGVELRLHPSTYCVAGGCVDGFDDDPVSVGSPSELLVYTGLTGFDDLVVTQTASPDTPGIPSPVSNLGDGWWLVEPAGPAEEYRVELFAGGDGDSIADLMWTITAEALQG